MVDHQTAAKLDSVDGNMMVTRFWRIAAPPFRVALKNFHSLGFHGLCSSIGPSCYSSPRMPLMHFVRVLQRFSDL